MSNVKGINNLFNALQRQVLQNDPLRSGLNGNDSEAAGIKINSFEEKVDQILTNKEGASAGVNQLGEFNKLFDAQINKIKDLEKQIEGVNSLEKSVLLANQLELEITKAVSIRNKVISAYQEIMNIQL